MTNIKLEPDDPSRFRHIRATVIYERRVPDPPRIIRIPPPPPTPEPRIIRVRWTVEPGGAVEQAKPPRSGTNGQRILTLLAGAPHGLRLYELHATLGKHGGSVSKAVTRLIHRGHITKIDVRWQITPSGIAALEAMDAGGAG